MGYTRAVVNSEQLGQLYRTHSGAILARIIRLAGGDFALAEEAVQDAFSAALLQWPADGVPEYPRAWLARTAHNKAIDRIRRQSRFEAPLPAEELAADSGGEPDPDAIDDQLRLIFTCCHPALAAEAQVALTLRTLCGLTTDEIARAFLVEPATMAQRLVRAQQKIKLAKIPYVVPERDELAERVEAVLSVVYLVFNEGYAATAGDTLLRRELCGEALRLGYLLERLLPERVEISALLALMLLHDSRSETRFDAAGELVLLEEQDRSRWNREQIEAGLQRVERALATGVAPAYAIQAAIAALHARAATAAETDWPQIALLYAELMRRAPSPVVALNHAAAVGMAHGAEAGLALLDELRGEPVMQGYHLYFAARADLLRRAGRAGDAKREYQRALELVRTGPEKRFLERRLREIG
ncbi:MAG TPA: sigma-70 family RNA polymerase sigma factor [Polyangiales bacterium]|nr:sigma-70 family RNA polymerase sigma factor [Polyangiales bacterium]